MTAQSRDTADAPLRRDVRLLGDILGRILVEQEGAELFEEEERIQARSTEEHARAVAAVLEIVGAKELLDRHPVVQRSIRLRNPYVDPMNAIQVELLRRLPRPGRVRGKARTRSPSAPALHRRSRRGASQHRLVSSPRW